MIYRFDTHSGSSEQLTDPNIVRFKLQQMAVSDDLSQIAFKWGWSLITGEVEPFGLWLLDMH